MSAPPIQLEAPAVSGRLQQRLESLGVSIIGVEGNLRAVPMGQCGWVERLIASSGPFAAAMKRLWGALVKGPREPVLVWPGLWVVPLTEARRRRGEEGPMALALLLGPALMHCEQFHRVCDSQGVDYQAALAQLKGDALLSPGEVERFAATLRWMHEDSQEMDRRHHELQSLGKQLGDSYEELSLLYKISSNMTVNQPAGKFLEDSCAELQQVAGLKWLALQLSADEPRLNQMAGQVFVAGDLPAEKEAAARVGQVLLLQYGASAQPVIIENTQAHAIPHLSQLASQMLVVPLRNMARPIGVLFGGDKLEGTALSSVDSKLCNALGGSLSIFLENFMLYEDMQAMFLGTLHALTSSIDAKDSYTRGHSERVALLSQNLATALGLETADRAYLAGLIHDVGKIGVPESVLTKPGPLTEAEFGLIKQHPEIGARIIQKIRQMRDLVPGVLHHHERWDGKGYPDGLKGAEIPIYGRIVGLADAFDAMSSTRAYRRSLSRGQVLEEIQRCAGRQFDPELTALLAGMDLTGYFRMVEEHKAAERAAVGV